MVFHCYYATFDNFALSQLTLQVPPWALLVKIFDYLKPEFSCSIEIACSLHPILSNFQLSRKVSLRNRQFVRKIETPMPVSKVKPSQFYDAHHDEVDEVQNHRGEDAEHGGRGQLLDDTDMAVSDGGTLVDSQVDQQDRVPVDGVDGGVVDTAVDQQPGVSGKRTRKPNSKYDPAVFDLSSVEMRGIPLSGRKNGWQGVYWPQ